MDAMVKKYQCKFRKARGEMNRWDELHSRLVSVFRNASGIVERFQVHQESQNFGNLSCIGDDALTREEFRIIFVSLEQIYGDSRQMIKGGSLEASMKPLKQRVGVKQRYLLKPFVVMALPKLVLMPS